MTENYQIRIGDTVNEKEDLFAIWLENNQKATNQLTIECYKRYFNESLKYVDGSFHVLVAVFEGEIIGYQSALPMRNNPLNWQEHALSSTYVKPKHQGSGIGYLLLKKMLERLPQTNINLFFGQTIANNTTMIAIGEKLGFKKIGEIPKSIRTPQTEQLHLYVYNVPDQ